MEQITVSKLVRGLSGTSRVFCIPPAFLLSAPTRYLTLADEMGAAPTYVFSAEGSLGFFLNRDTSFAREVVTLFLEDLTSTFLFERVRQNTPSLMQEDHQNLDRSASISQHPGQMADHQLPPDTRPADVARNA